MERTFIMIKPDAIKRRLISRIIQRFEEKGLYLAASKCVIPKREVLETHYSHLSSMPFFSEMVEDMMSGMVLAMVWVGKDAVSIGRKLIGETNPQAASVGTIRGDYGVSTGKNIIHGSDCVENAEKEIKLWIGDDVQPVSFFDKEWIY
ncbi:NUCLEOSIDE DIPHOSPHATASE KINASE A [Encephalitozoon cuniculi GB-M1]|uniref:Nucleoside diphosphate kinase n=2 Tax=Encephalitozoon cuniculi TaxID=6035 RepID=NDK_ENCCU|nr:nucleoside diphosphatase kinase A [Encephalitozoon cuniculi GB-M1]Q8SRM7.1 RecName: Full=Nucleoside diphosphate kinase; Short=NDK; Short=NDP kinase; Short=NDPK [Encephalitozoon cuniculi GB-M1]UYI27750.1 nucleoside diphosphatase kinase [Encephalitozoon cuniculi]CAD25514.1 NUCLEOSIDE DIPHOSPHATASE KINASE A [Encephalitozoon cuniculi GB-M1]